MQWIGAGVFVASVWLIRRDTGLQIADENTWWDSLFPDSRRDEAGDLKNTEGDT
jgi:hypothetical protein